MQSVTVQVINLMLVEEKFGMLQELQTWKN